MLTIIRTGHRKPYIPEVKQPVWGVYDSTNKICILREVTRNTAMSYLNKEKGKIIMTAHPLPTKPITEGEMEDIDHSYMVISKSPSQD